MAVSLPYLLNHWCHRWLVSFFFLVKFLVFCFFYTAELEAGVVRAGPEGAGPKRASVTLHLPRAAPRPPQRLRHAAQNLHTPQEVRGLLTGPPPTGTSFAFQSHPECLSCFLPFFWPVHFLCFFLGCSLLKDYTIQHLPDGTVMVESIVIKVSSSAEDANSKVLLLSWSYQVQQHHSVFMSAAQQVVL